MPVPIAAVRGRASVIGGSAAAPTGEYRKSITVESTLVSADLTDFPVLVKLASDSDLAAHASGTDFRVTTSDGVTTCPHEVEAYNASTGALTLWFKAPSLSSTSDTTFYLYYGGSDNADDPANVWDSDYQFVHHYPYAFVPDAGNPVFSSGRFCSVVKSGSTFHMYYSNATGDIRHATSSDGITWTDDAANNPVLSGTAAQWDSAQVWLPRVWIDGSTWYMLYTGRDESGDNHIGYATSSDGITWTKYGSNPILSGTAAAWDDGDVELSSIMKVGSTWYLYYNTQNASPRQTGIATASNLNGPWTKDANNPIFGGGRFCGDVFKYGSHYYYCTPHYTGGTDYAELELYRDSSPTFYNANRTFLGVIKPPGAPGAWDGTDQDVPWIVTDTIGRDTYTGTGGKLYLYYSGYSATTSLWKTGLLVADWPARALVGDDSTLTHGTRIAGSSGAGPQPVSAAIGGGRDYIATAGLYIDDNAEFDVAANAGWTIEVIATPDVVTSTRTLMVIRNASTSTTLAMRFLYFNGTSVTAQIRQDGGTEINQTVASSLVAGTTYRVALKRDTAGVCTLYVNGTKTVLTGTVSGAMSVDQGPSIGINKFGSNLSSPFDGKIVEARLSSVARSDAWLETAYNCELNNGSFITLGGEEAV